MLYLFLFFISFLYPPVCGFLYTETLPVSILSTSGGQSTTESPKWKRRGPTTYRHVGRLYPQRLALRFVKRLSGRPGRLHGIAPRNACERTAFDVHGSIDCQSIEAQWHNFFSFIPSFVKSPIPLLRKCVCVRFYFWKDVILPQAVYMLFSTLCR